MADPERQPYAVAAIETVPIYMPANAVVALNGVDFVLEARPEHLTAATQALNRDTSGVITRADQTKLRGLTFELGESLNPMFTDDEGEEYQGPVYDPEHGLVIVVPRAQAKRGLSSHELARTIENGINGKIETGLNEIRMLREQRAGNLLKLAASMATGAAIGEAIEVSGSPDFATIAASTPIRTMLGIASGAAIGAGLRQAWRTYAEGWGSVSSDLRDEIHRRAEAQEGRRYVRQPIVNLTPVPTRR